MKVCNCKSVNPTIYHETKVFNGDQCYYCGHIALEGTSNIPNNNYKLFLKDPWRNGPFTYAKKRVYKTGKQRKQRTTRITTPDKIKEAYGLYKEGFPIQRIADAIGLKNTSLRELIRRHYGPLTLIERSEHAIERENSRSKAVKIDFDNLGKTPKPKKLGRPYKEYRADKDGVVKQKKNMVECLRKLNVKRRLDEYKEFKTMGISNTGIAKIWGMSRQNVDLFVKRHIQ